MFDCTDTCVNISCTHIITVASVVIERWLQYILSAYTIICIVFCSSLFSTSICSSPPLIKICSCCFPLINTESNFPFPN